VRTLLFLLANLGANTGAHLCLKRSAQRTKVRAFLFWQVLGNLGAFLGVLAYTAVLRDLSLHVAYPLTEGLTAIGVQVVGGVIVFREKISAVAWAGTGLILAGIVLFNL
jgi:multidrug transporter EmrE-like cation transporter